ncbi:MAG TPA: hypothetical protein VEC15_04560 [Actinomycetota bacterium]|nr:hypothetical protein [Actinomycetota bacterium]
MDTAGDGFFAVFDSPGAAIRCAVAITEAVREVGREVRAGLHGGEVISSEGKAGVLGSVWVASGGEVLEVDTTTARVVRTIEIGDNPVSSVAVDEEDGVLWLDIAAMR